MICEISLVRSMFSLQIHYKWKKKLQVAEKHEQGSMKSIVVEYCGVFILLS